MFVEKRLIVQFTHPGGEHSPDRGKSVKSWNTGGHKRKFMLSNGSVVINDNLLKNKSLLFWGEWEPDSLIIKVLNTPSGAFPKYLYKPIIENLPNHSRQNTDPYVFGDNFYYFCCKQSKQGSPTQLGKLQKGSIILFGSTINQTKPNAYFALDTVFVVNEFIDYNSLNYDKMLAGKVDNDFFEISIKSRFNQFPQLANTKIQKKSSCLNTCMDNEETKKSSSCSTPTNIENFRCYFGATFEKKVEGMYSFVPCKEYNDNSEGFERLKLTNADFDFITNNLNASPKYTTNRNVIEVWHKLKEILKNKGFIEGVKFDFEKSNNLKTN